jgi:hypothetical protein
LLTISMKNVIKVMVSLLVILNLVRTMMRLSLRSPCYGLVAAAKTHVATDAISTSPSIINNLLDNTLPP